MGSGAIRSFAKRWAPALLCTLAALYFVFQGLTGDHGLGAYIQARASIEELRAEHKSLAKRLADTREEARRLDPKDPDPDYLEELIRSRLGYVRAGEEVRVRGGSD